MPRKRRCKGKTKAGLPCLAPPLKGSTRCISHSPKELRGSKRFGGPQPGSGRPPNPKLTDVLRERVEIATDAILAPYFKALGIELDEHARPVLDEDGRPKLTQGAILAYKGEATSLEDLAAQMNAAQQLIDRVYGKPRQALEHTGAEGGPITVADLAWLTGT